MKNKIQQSETEFDTHTRMCTSVCKCKLYRNLIVLYTSYTAPSGITKHATNKSATANDATK